MLVLGIDTATQVCSVALADADCLLAEITINTKKTHSERLMPYIAQLLTYADIDKGELSGIAVSLGPGSFTGLRIGLASAKAMAYALDIPLVGVSTLEALAFACPLPGTVLSPMLDAQKGNVYQGIYCWQDGSLTVITPPRIMPFTEALAELAAGDRKVTVLGEGVRMYSEFGSSYDNVLLPQPHIAMPRAAAAAIMGTVRLAGGGGNDAQSVEPIYIRRSEAEELWEKRHGKQ